MVKIAGIVVLYHPTESVVNSVESYIHKVDRLYIFDNSELNEASRFFANNDKTTIFFDGKNEGISKRLNQGCLKAMEEGFDWMLTMDQDTFFKENTLNYYLSNFEGYVSKNKVAAFGTRYGISCEPSQLEMQAEDVSDIITSAMLLNLNIWKKIGGFDEAFFIDSVDIDYCLNAISNGYKVVRFNNIFVTHEIGSWVVRSSIKSLYTIRKKKMIHSALRCYYMYRNMLYIEKKYKSNFPDFCSYLRAIVQKHVGVCFFYGRQMTAVLYYVNRAKKDFYSGRMGKIDSHSFKNLS